LEYPIGIVITPSGLNVREAPTVTSKLLTTLPLGSQLELLEQQTDYSQVSDLSGKWTKIKLGERVGWVLAAQKLLSTTKSFTFELHVAKARGADLHESPLPNTPVVAHLPYGSRVQVQTEGFQSDAVDVWTVAVAGSRRGFMLEQDLTTVSYPAEAFQNGPFVGLTYTSLPETCQFGSGGVIENGNEESDFFLFSISCNGHGTYVLAEVLRRVGRHSEFKVVQLVSPALGPSDTVVLGGPGLRDLTCMNAQGMIPLAVVNLSKGSSVRGADRVVTYSNVVSSLWIFDRATKRLKASPEIGATCSAPPGEWFN